MPRFNKSFKTLYVSVRGNFKALQTSGDVFEPYFPKYMKTLAWFLVRPNFKSSLHIFSSSSLYSCICEFGSESKTVAIACSVDFIIIDDSESLIVNMEISSNFLFQYGRVERNYLILKAIRTRVGGLVVCTKIFWQSDTKYCRWTRYLNVTSMLLHNIFTNR